MICNVNYNELKDNHVYLVPRLFPGYKTTLIQKHGCVYDLCRYSIKHQYDCVGKMTYFYIINTDARYICSPYGLWQTSCKKSALSHEGRMVYHTIDVTNLYANKIQKWCKTQLRNRAGKYIAYTLFEYMIQPKTGWLYKKHLQSFNTVSKRN